MTLLKLDIATYGTLFCTLDRLIIHVFFQNLHSFSFFFSQNSHLFFKMHTFFFSKFTLFFILFFSKFNFFSSSKNHLISPSLMKSGFHREPSLIGKCPLVLKMLV